LTGWHGLEWMKDDPGVDLIGRLGVLVLLFEVGLESTVGQMLKVGGSSLAVATLGVIAPFGLGFCVSAWLLPGSSVYVHCFLGATLTATSVGITARVLKDLGQEKSPEARIILGAAVIDDVMGLVMLAVVGGLIAAADRGGSMSYGAIALVLGKAIGFLIGALVIGVLFSKKVFAAFAHLKSKGVLVAIGLSFCFVLAWLADLIGLAPIVGAFAAGLILEDAHYVDFVSKGEHQLEELIQPISSFLAPVFFVLMGMRTDLSAFAHLDVLALAAMLTVAAIVGKQACALGVIGGGVHRLSVGVGMIPRGEVGLVFANLGMQLTVAGEHVIEKSTYAAVLIMVIVTTLVTPPALKWALARKPKAA
jgi:Kef-type K+ transport system membrane component KefB